MGFYSILEQIHVYFHAKNQKLLMKEFHWSRDLMLAGLKFALKIRSP